MTMLASDCMQAAALRAQSEFSSGLNENISAVYKSLEELWSYTWVVNAKGQQLNQAITQLNSEASLAGPEAAGGVGGCAVALGIGATVFGVGLIGGALFCAGGAAAAYFGADPSEFNESAIP